MFKAEGFYAQLSVFCSCFTINTSVNALFSVGKLENMRGVETWQPVVWKNTFGEGRVFACSLGHDIDTYRRINYLTLFVRGAEWAATGKVTLDKPDRSGENRFNAWPYYS